VPLSTNILKIHDLALAPLGKSDHAVLMIESNIFSQGCALEQKLNYDKGDYDALRSYVSCDWDKEFTTLDLDVEAMWNLLKDKIDSGVKCCIPLTSRFQNTKWKRPLNDEIRDQINTKKGFGGNMFEIKILRVGKNIQNNGIKLRKLLDMISKNSRMQLLNSIGQILKNFGNTLTLRLSIQKK